MGKENSIFKVIQIFDNIVEAKLFTSKLESEGIQCFLENTSVLNLDPLLNFAVGGIRVTVEEHDFEKAMLMVKEYSKKPIIGEDGDILTCPKCGSDEIQGGYSNIQDAQSFIGLLIGICFAVVPFLARDKYNCSNCHNVFKIKK